MTHRKVISTPKGENPKTAGLAVVRDRPHPAKGDIQIINFFNDNHTAETVHVDDDEIEELIEALKEVKQ